jgi:hypothetical protein
MHGRSYACLATLLFLCASCSKPPPPRVDGPPPRFTLVAADRSGVAFQNQLTEGPNTNILVYEYFYNGGGVATADFNGDGLSDLYFTANMHANRLYLNDGDFRFSDVTEVSGTAGQSGPWNTGVSVVDINADGKPDIYLSYSGMLPPDKRRNQLFVNQGNTSGGIPTFVEAAADYGLDSPAFTTQTYFADYDADGDLDAFLLNHNPESLPILNEERTRLLQEKPDSLRGLRLLRNDQGRYVDVTEAAGLDGSALSYGLGLALSDLNGDGRTDLYVSNDYEVPDYLYLNNGDGTFTDRLAEQLDHTSHFSMGSDVADVNNDLLPDIFTLDMLPADGRRRKLLMPDNNRPRHELTVAKGWHHQTMRNMLHLNQGNDRYVETALGAGVDATDWSWSALLADLDNDGWKDLHVTNGYLRDYTNLDFIKYMNDYVGRKGRLQRNDVLELLREMPASGVSNFVFRNEGAARFRDRTEEWGLSRPSNSTGAVAVDLDGDGDLDLAVNNVNDTAFLYRNETSGSNFLAVRLRGEASNPAGIGARVTVVTADGSQMIEHYPYRGYQSSGPFALHFGLGARAQVQSVRVEWPSGKLQLVEGVPSNQVIELEEGLADEAVRPVFPQFNERYRSVALDWDFIHRPTRVSTFDIQPLVLRDQNDTGPPMIVTDLNADGRDDLVVGGGVGQPSQYALMSNRAYSDRLRTLGPPPRAGGVVTGLAVVDWNGDGHPDIYEARGGNVTPGTNLQDRVFLHTGRGGAFAGVVPVLGSDFNTSCVAATGVGSETVLFLGGGAIGGRYPETAASRLLWASNGKTEELDLTGVVSAATWSDLDGDGSDELIVVGEWMPIRVFGWSGGGLEDRSDEFFPRPMPGWWKSLAVGDVNGDGRPDLVVGNQGTNYRFRPTSDEPVRLLAEDINSDGSVDPVLFAFEGGRSVPVADRDELLAQLPELRRSYTDYATYAGATQQEILSLLGGSDRLLEVNEARSMLFLLQDNGTFAPRPLPRPAQYAPVHAVHLTERDENGPTTLLLGGNESGGHLTVGRSGANLGQLYEWKSDSFHYVAQTRSGLSLRGEVRSIVGIDDRLYVGINGGKVAAYAPVREAQ